MPPDLAPEDTARASLHSKSPSASGGTDRSHESYLFLPASTTSGDRSSSRLLMDVSTSARYSAGPSKSTLTRALLALSIASVVETDWMMSWTAYGSAP
ncbi:predicted protein [Micromonas commoda]|uniref:Uncharacterized protein n=1 Tax=Micromonas commoda (strain RCC299 / NOUM17 / CCMP2709) TaxID=296587 RepID=C1E6S0_MICCC|nr:predicted protein [Micromonas commoda]ACO63852.1 predicted protein [Micromonas commoda]|eukprot:XP_002502594.1 predicted protein [Micromonas commoda]